MFTMETCLWPHLHRPMFGGAGEKQEQAKSGSKRGVGEEQEQERSRRRAGEEEEQERSRRIAGEEQEQERRGAGEEQPCFV